MAVKTERERDRGGMMEVVVTTGAIRRAVSNGQWKKQQGISYTFRVCKYVTHKLSTLSHSKIAHLDGSMD